MYKKIKIENFRGINNLELNNLRQFNLLVGKNNCGKTSLLESIFIISNPADPFSPFRISNARGHYQTQPHSWTVFFNKMDIESPIRLTGEILWLGKETTSKLKIILIPNISMIMTILVQLTSRAYGASFFD